MANEVFWLSLLQAVAQDNKRVLVKALHKLLVKKGLTELWEPSVSMESLRLRGSVDSSNKEEWGGDCKRKKGGIFLKCSKLSLSTSPLQLELTKWI